MFDNETFGFILSNKMIRYIGRSIVHKINHESGIKWFVLDWNGCGFGNGARVDKRDII